MFMVIGNCKCLQSIENYIECQTADSLFKVGPARFAAFAVEVQQHPTKVDRQQ